jgi:hypothetical protein
MDEFGMFFGRVWMEMDGVWILILSWKKFKRKVGFYLVIWV